MSEMKSDALIAVEALSSLPIGSEIVEDESVVIYRNGAGSITVGDVLAAKRAVSRLIWWQNPLATPAASA